MCASIIICLTFNLRSNGFVNRLDFFVLLIHRNYHILQILLKNKCNHLVKNRKKIQICLGDGNIFVFSPYIFGVIYYLFLMSAYLFLLMRILFHLLFELCIRFRKNHHLDFLLLLYSPGNFYVFVTNQSFVWYMQNWMILYYQYCY